MANGDPAETRQIGTGIGGNRKIGQNLDVRSHRSGAGCGFGRGENVGGIRQDVNNIRGGGIRGGSGKNTPPPTNTDRDIRAAVRTVRTEVGWSKEQMLWGVMKTVHVG